KCWSEKIGYKCCTDAEIYLTDTFGHWSIEDGEWCLVKRSCFAEKLGYSCCISPSSAVLHEDKDGKWGIEYGKWCGL
ncbi:hypothetical protein BCR32DRAFT_196154, partial [Anaeromyces robustus]